jgi:gluconolactonase
VPSPGGLVLSLNERVLAWPPPAATRLAVPSDDGSVAKFIFIQMTGGGGPDGISMERPATCRLSIGLGAVWLFSPGRTHPARRHAQADATNIAFGGPDRKTAYVTDRAGRHPQGRMPFINKRMFSGV